MNKFIFLVFLFSIALASATHIPLHRRKHLTHEWQERAVAELEAKGEWEPTKAIPAPPPRSLIEPEQRRRAAPGDIPLRGNRQRIGEIYIDFYLGTPSRLFTAQLDTGSSDLSIAAAGCTTCSPVTGNNLYDPDSSSTAKTARCSGQAPLDCPKCGSSNQCEYSDRYGDGSGFDAYEVSDRFVIGNFSAVNQYVGAITDEENPGVGGFEPRGVDGIAGIAYQRLSSVNAPTFIDSLVASGQTRDQFSICLTEEGGTLTVGEIPPYYTGKIQWTPITKKLWYVVDLVDFGVGGKSADLSQRQLNAGNVIWDSGTTAAIINHNMYAAFQRLLEAECRTTNLVGVCNTNGKGLFDGYCERLDEQDIAKYPAVDFSFQGGANATLPASAYLSQGMCRFSGYYGLALINGGRSGSILGDIFMQQYLTIHDRESNPNRIGFAPVAHCPNGNDAPIPPRP